MPFEIEYNEVDGVISTVYTPPFSLAQAMKAVVRNLQMQKSTGCLLFIGDATALPTGDLADAHRLAMAVEIAGFDRRSREAMIILPSAHGHRGMEFYETVTTNRGMQVRVFTNRSEALDWLHDTSAD